MNYRIFGFSVVKRGNQWTASAETPGRGKIIAVGATSREAMILLSATSPHLAKLAPITSQSDMKGAA